MFRRLRTTIRGAERRHRDRIDYDDLLRFNDHLLKDIGLTRDQVRHARLRLDRP